MGAKKGIAASDELERLVAMVDAYESEHFPMDQPTPEALRQFLLEQQGTIK
jgi:antitoxin component HigA of HigAB toxin-antitoxin module